MGIAFFLLYLTALFGFILYFTLRKKPAWKPPLTLSQFPDPAKLAAALLLFAYALVHVLAGGEAYLKSRESFASAEEYFHYMSLVKLAATSHAHLFGHGTMYFLTSVLFLFSTVSVRTKTLLIGLSLAAGLIDVPAWWMIKYYGGFWEIFAGLSGLLYVAGWGCMAARIIWELRKPSDSRFFN